ncbi:MAG: hypothetical protein ACFE9S_14475 [Candidatus Hermodarchaeota archaeon]
MHEQNDYLVDYITEDLQSLNFHLNRIWKKISKQVVTMVRVIPLSAFPPKSYNFRADHSFLYLSSILKKEQSFLLEE